MNQERYSELVDLKLRHVLVKRDGAVFNNRFEGDPKSGAVKVPVRDTETNAAAYDKTTGTSTTSAATAYQTVTIDKDYAVNEIIDGYDAAAAPDGLVADRLDSAAYSLALVIEQDGTDALEAAATAFGGATALTKATVYNAIVDARTEMSAKKVPSDNRRFLLVSPEVYGMILKSPEFVSAISIGESCRESGAQGRIAGFNVFEDATLSEGVEFIAGHPDWCTRVNEWQVPVHLQDLGASGKFIGASAVQGRRIWAHKVTKPATLLIKKTA